MDSDTENATATVTKNEVVTETLGDPPATTLSNLSLVTEQEIGAEKRPQFGQRHLVIPEDVFTRNAWDNVVWSEEQFQDAREKVANNSIEKIPIEKRQQLTMEAHKSWDTFYDIHVNRFFKDRNWLFTEFPELHPDKPENTVPRTFFEIGCGVGNTILPLATAARNQNDLNKWKFYGCDFSSRAIEVLRESRYFNPKTCEVFVMDVSKEIWDVPFPENSMDFIILIFVLSAIEPAKMKFVAKNCFRYLKSGGKVLFRDYGRYDLAQLRFKNGKCLEDNFYVRGDNTFVYFFTEEELRDLFCNVGFLEEFSYVDRRLQVNRIREKKMYRVWLQKKFTKP